MAQIENSSRRHSKSRTARRRINIDLTPMVDLGFLLITFFMLSTSLSTPNSMDLVMPRDSPVHTLLRETAVLTLMPVRNNDIEYFEGRNAAPGSMKHCSFTEVRQVIQEKRRRVAQMLGSKNETVIIIDPGPESTYKNLVDLLDEIHINDIHHYFIVDHSKDAPE
jgi:biopolymer transport protein ExbD